MKIVEDDDFWNDLEDKHEVANNERDRLHANEENIYDSSNKPFKFFHFASYETILPNHVNIKHYLILIDISFYFRKENKKKCRDVSLSSLVMLNYTFFQKFYTEYSSDIDECLTIL